jgi:predicted transcriptional regulator
MKEFKMADKEIVNLLKNIEKNQKDLTTKYNVLVKRTNSIITSLSEINEKLDFLVETMSMFELADDEDGEDDEDDYEDFNPYQKETEDYEEEDEDDT